MPEQTCGRGLAENSRLPAKMGEVVDLLAENLERHIPGLDVNDMASRIEKEVYERLAGTFRGIAESLRLAAEDMSAQRDLEMGRHDMDALSTPEVADTFSRFVAAEEELLELLRGKLEQERAMLAQMPGAQPDAQSR
jgi:hypothetical protein